MLSTAWDRDQTMLTDLSHVVKNIRQSHVALQQQLAAYFESAHSAATAIKNTAQSIADGGIICPMTGAIQASLQNQFAIAVVRLTSLGTECQLMMNNYHERNKRTRLTIDLNDKFTQPILKQQAAAREAGVAPEKIEPILPHHFGQNERTENVG
jgi:hypothetical protein